MSLPFALPYFSSSAFRSGLQNTRVPLQLCRRTVCGYTKPSFRSIRLTYVLVTGPSASLTSAHGTLFFIVLVSSNTFTAPLSAPVRTVTSGPKRGGHTRLESIIFVSAGLDKIGIAACCNLVHQRVQSVVGATQARTGLRTRVRRTQGPVEYTSAQFDSCDMTCRV